MCSRHREAAQVAGRPQPDEDATAPAVGSVPTRDTLRQPTLFEFGVRPQGQQRPDSDNDNRDLNHPFASR